MPLRALDLPVDDLVEERARVGPRLRVADRKRGAQPGLRFVQSIAGGGGVEGYRGCQNVTRTPARKYRGAYRQVTGP